MKGRAVPIYRPGVNLSREIAIPACNLPTPGGPLVFVRRDPPKDAGGGVWISLRWWRRADGLAVAASLEPLPHQSVTSKPRFLHISISRADRYPGWDEMVQVVEAIAGPNVDMAMIKPRRADYISPHPNCFHWWEMPVEWGLQ